MFDKSQVYDEKVAPLVDQLKKLCYREKIPMFFCAAIKEDQKETVYKNEMISSAVAETPLQDDRIAKLVNVILGYDVVPHEQLMEMEFDYE